MKHSRPIIKLMMASDLHVVRLMLGIAELIWAVTLLYPGETFGRPTYFGMQRVMDENAWGFLFLASGLFQLGILKWGDYWDGWCIAFSGLNCMLWNFVVLSMYFSVWPPPAAVSGELVLAGMATWLFVRAGTRITARDSRFRVPPKLKGGDSGLIRG